MTRVTRAQTAPGKPEFMPLKSMRSWPGVGVPLTVPRKFPSGEPLDRRRATAKLPPKEALSAALPTMTMPPSTGSMATALAVAFEEVLVEPKGGAPKVMNGQLKLTTF